MATIKDTYQLDSKTSDAGIKQATGSVKGLDSAIRSIGKIGSAPFKAIHAGIAGIGKGINLISRGMGAFGKVAQGFNQLKQTVGAVFTALRDKSPALNEALTKFEEGFQKAVGPVLEKLGNALVPIFEKLAVVMASPEFQKFVDMITNLLIKGLNDLMPVLEGVIKFLGDLFTAIDTGDWSTVWATITSIVETAWGNFKSWFETNWNVFWTQTVPAAWTAFKQLFEAGWTTFWNITAPAAWTTFKQLLELGWNTFWNVTIPAAWESFKMLFQIAWDTFWNGIRTVAEGIWNGIKTAWDNFWGGLRDGVQSALDWLQGKSGTATAGANAISGGVMGKPSTGTALPGMGGIPRMAAGGIVGSPMLAMVGDAPRRKGGEVIAPLTDLMGMIQQAIGGGGPTINIYGPFGPGYTPAQAGAQAAAGYANQMRARGAKI